MSVFKCRNSNDTNKSKKFFRWTKIKNRNLIFLTFFFFVILQFLPRFTLNELSFIDFFLRFLYRCLFDWMAILSRVSSYANDLKWKVTNDDPENGFENNPPPPPLRLGSGKFGHPSRESPPRTDVSGESFWLSLFPPSPPPSASLNGILLNWFGTIWVACFRFRGGDPFWRPLS